MTLGKLSSYIVVSVIESIFVFICYFVFLQINSSSITSILSLSIMGINFFFFGSILLYLFNEIIVMYKKRFFIISTQLWATSFIIPLVVMGITFLITMLSIILSDSKDLWAVFTILPFGTGFFVNNICFKHYYDLEELVNNSSL